MPDATSSKPSRAWLLALIAGTLLIATGCGSSAPEPTAQGDGGKAADTAATVKIEPLSPRTATGECPFTEAEIEQVLSVPVVRSDEGGNACQFVDSAGQVDLWIDWNDDDEQLVDSYQELIDEGGTLSERPRWGPGAAVILSSADSPEAQAVLMSGRYRTFIGLRHRDVSTDPRVAEVDVLGDALSSAS